MEKTDNTQSLKSKGTIKTIIISAIISSIAAFIVTAVTFKFLEEPHDKEMIYITQEYAYKNALAQKRLEFSEKIIGYRQMALTWLDRIGGQSILKVSEKDKDKMLELSMNILRTNSVSLLYGKQPYNTIMNYDELSKNLFFDILNKKIDQKTFKKKRERLGKYFDIMVSVLRKNAISDSGFINLTSKKGFDVYRFK